MIFRENPRIRLRLTAGFLSAAIGGNSIASPPSLFPRKRRYAQIEYRSGRQPSSRTKLRAVPSLCKGGWRSRAAAEGLSCYNSLQKASLRYAFCAPICRLRGFSEKVNAPSAIMKALMGRRRGKTTVSAQRVSEGFSSNHEFSYRGTRKKDFTERFFAKRSGERFRRTVR